MFGTKHNGAESPEVTALLERGCEFEGKLTFEGTVRINGQFKGEIFSDGTLIIGAGAEVEGQIEVGSVTIEGALEGEIVAKERIEMHSPARVTGNIRSRTLVIDEGVIFEGNCRMGEPAAVTIPISDRHAAVAAFDDADEGASKQSALY